MHQFAAAVAGITIACASLSACGSTDVPQPAAVELTLSKDTLSPGDTAHLTARVRSENGATIAGAPIRWRSLNPALVLVDSIGNAWAYGLGPTAPATVTIEAVAGGVVGRIDVVVRARPVTLSINWPSRLRRTGSVDTLTATTYGSTGLPITGTPLAWISSDPSVVFVTNDGIATMRRPGRALITGSAGPIHDTLTISVVQGFALVDISAALGDSIILTAANDSGAYTGVVILPDFSRRGFYWRDGRLSPIPACNAADLNNAFQVLCGSSIWNARTGTRTDLTARDTALIGAAINDSGDVFAAYPNDPGHRFGVWRKGTFMATPLTADSAITNEILDIDNRGDLLISVQVLNQLYGYSTMRRLSTESRWTLSTVGRSGSSGRMNNRGDVPLTARFAGMSPNAQAYLFLAEGRMLLIASDKTGQVQVTAASVNDARDLVGTASFEGASVGYLWRDGVLGALDDLVEAPDWTITQGVFVDNTGAITARAKNRRTGRMSYVRLVPQPIVSVIPTRVWPRAQ